MTKWLKQFEIVNKVYQVKNYVYTPSVDDMKLKVSTEDKQFNLILSEPAATHQSLVQHYFCHCCTALLTTNPFIIYVKSLG